MGLGNKLDLVKFDEITVDAKTENLEKVQEFLEASLEKLDAPIKVVTQMNVVVDELFANVSSYAYGEETGTFTMKIGKLNDRPGAAIVVLDGGLEFNPLEAEDPDITASAEDRLIGGLGILVVKKFSDEIEYEYKNKQNSLTIIKYFS